MANRLCLLVLSLLVLAACSNRDESKFSNARGARAAVRPEIPEGVTFDQYLENYPIYDTQGLEQPIVPDRKTGLRPLGVLISNSPMAPICSASHVVRGYVAVAAHCVEYPERPLSKMLPNELGLVYFDKQGKKRHAYAEAYSFVGTRLGMDIAVLKINSQVADQWDAIGGKFLNTTTLTNGESMVEHVPPVVFPVTVWAFDPVYRSDTKFGRRGAQFQPKKCTASRTRFRFQGIVAGSTDLTQGPEIQLTNAGAEDPNNTLIHFVFDACSPIDSPIIGGNSGGLVTRGDSLEELVGVMHWKWTANNVDPKRIYQSYLVKGNNSYLTPRLVKRENGTSLDFLHTGTAFDAVLKALPTLFGEPVSLSPF